MKIFRATDESGRKYAEAKDYGGLRPFTEISLKTQLWALWLGEVPTAVRPYLMVFSKEDHAQTATLANQLLENDTPYWGLQPEIWAAYRILMQIYDEGSGNRFRVGFFALNDGKFNFVPPEDGKEEVLLAMLC